MKSFISMLLLNLLIFCGSSKTMQAQNIDSLKFALKEAPTEVDEIKTLIEIGAYYTSRNVDSSLYYEAKAHELSKLIKVDTLIALSAAELGIGYLVKGHLDISMKYQLEALRIYEDLGNEKAKIQMLNNIGLIYFYQNKFEAALVNFNRVVEATQASNDLSKLDKDTKVGRVLNNIGIIYDNQSQFDKSLEYYTQAVTASKAAGDQTNLASIYSNMGLVYLNVEKYDLSEVYLKDALEIRKSIGDVFGECKSYQHLGKLYKERGALNLAKETLLTGLEKCESVESLNALAQIMEQMSQTYALDGDFKQAYDYQSTFMVLKDSLNNSETQRKLTEAEMQYKFDKETQIMENIQQKKQYIYTIVGVVLFCIILLVVGLYLLQKSKTRNQELEKDKVELENKELSLRKQTLELELESRSKDLTTNVMYLIKKNELISEVSKRLISLKKLMKKENQRDIQRIIMDLQTAKDDDVWEEFEVRFNQVYNDYYERLNEQFPDLTSNERKICAFLKLNMTSKEICTLTRQSLNSLNVARTRLRKKLGLSNTNVNLATFLEKI